MNERLEEAIRNAEEASQHMLFTFAPEKFWEEKYREEVKHRMLDQGKQNSIIATLFIVSIFYGAAGFALGVWFK